LAYYYSRTFGDYGEIDIEFGELALANAHEPAIDAVRALDSLSPCRSIPLIARANHSGYRQTIIDFLCEYAYKLVIRYSQVWSADKVLTIKNNHKLTIMELHPKQKILSTPLYVSNIFNCAPLYYSFEVYI